MLEPDRLISQFSKKTILVVGDIMLDQFTIGEVSRISPEAPVPILRKRKEEFFLGGAANVANNLASLGAKVILCGFVGNDSRRNVIINLLRRSGIATKSILVSANRPTTFKQRFVDGGRHLLRFDDEVSDRFSFSEEKKLLSIIQLNIKKCDTIVLSDYNKGCFSENTAKKIITWAKDSGKKIIADFKPKNKNLFIGADIIAPNLKEGQEMSGFNKPEDVVLKLSSDMGADVVLTQGRDGVSVFMRDNKSYHHISGKKVRAIDVSGAGDTLIAILALGLASGLDLSSASFLANEAGAIVVQKPGTATLTDKELIAVIGTD